MPPGARLRYHGELSSVDWSVTPPPIARVPATVLVQRGENRTILTALEQVRLQKALVPETIASFVLARMIVLLGAEVRPDKKFVCG